MLRVGESLWIGEDDESPQPVIEYGYSEADLCAKCGASSRNAWIYAGWPGTRLLEVFLCRDCLIELVSYTYRHHESIQPVPTPRVSSPPEKKKRIVSNRPPISPAVRFEILKRDGYRCQLCGQSAAENRVLHLDHKVAVAVGGTNDIEN